jgi:hypothetical protein
MDIYSFINSQDVAAHCRELKKVWTPLEMAVIIERSNRSMPEKHEAFQELIDNHPDMHVPCGHILSEIPSLHNALEKKIDFEKRAFEIFKIPKPGVIYKSKGRFDLHNNLDYSEGGSVFASYDEAFKDILESWGYEHALEVVVDRLHIGDENIAKGESNFTAYFDRDGTLYDLGYSGRNLFGDTDSMGSFTDNYIDIPTPYKRGDILIAKHRLGHKSEPFVLDATSRELLENVAKRTGNPIGMYGETCGSGFFVNDDGVLYFEHIPSSDHLEYYRGKLQGKYALLHYVSLFMNDKIPLPELLTMQCRLMLEHKLNTGLDIYSHGCCIADKYLAENRIPFGEEKQNEERNE